MDDKKQKQKEANEGMKKKNLDLDAELKEIHTKAVKTKQERL